MARIRAIFVSGLSAVLITVASVALAPPAAAASAWTPISVPTTTTFNDVAAQGSSAYAVGAGGKVFASSNKGASWSAKASPQAGDLFAVEMAEGFCNGGTADCVWAAGAGGVIWFSNDGGATWCAQTTGTTQTILGLASRGPNDVIGVGANGTILRSALSSGAANARQCGNAGMYDIVPSGTTRTLRDVASDLGSPSELIAGDGGTILSMVTAGPTVNQVSALASGTTSDLHGIGIGAGAADTRTWAVGQGGTIVSRLNSGAFGPQTSGTTELLRDVDALSDVDAAAVGPVGLVLAFRSGSWGREPANTCNNLRRLTAQFVSSSEMGYIAVGEGGVVLDDRPNTTGPQPTCTTSKTSGGGPTLSNGYRMIGADGGVFTFGQRTFPGSAVGMRLNAQIVDATTNPVTLAGYWLLGADGGVLAFGDAGFFGSLGGAVLASPAVGIAATMTGKGYWIVQANGKVTPFGDAKSYGDMSKTMLNEIIIGIAASPKGAGYWLVGLDGGVFAFGDAPFFGSTGNRALNAPVIALGSLPNGAYYLVALDGGVFTFGAAPFHGSTGGKTLNAPVVAILVASSGGYWLIAADGGVFTFGNVPFLGSMGGKPLEAPILDATA